MKGTYSRLLTPSALALGMIPFFVAAPLYAITLAERLHNAAAAGDKKALRKAMDDGAPLDGLLGEERISALMAAASRGQAGSIKILLKAKASVDLKDASGAAALLYTGAPRALAKDQDELTDAAKALLKGGADPNLPDKKGWRPLMAAAAAKNGPLVELLLEEGANPRAKNAAGQTALDAAKEAGDADIYKTLREAVGR
jgi:ankyrin repeat protein